MDSAFPQFPIKRRQTSRSEHAQLTADFKRVPVSPRLPDTDRLLHRMNSIAPGPFDARRIRPLLRSQTEPMPVTPDTKDTSTTTGGGMAVANARSASASSKHETDAADGLRIRTVIDNAAQEQATETIHKKHPASNRTLTSENRSKTFPLETDSSRNGGSSIETDASYPGLDTAVPHAVQKLVSEPVRSGTPPLRIHTPSSPTTAISGTENGAVILHNRASGNEISPEQPTISPAVGTPYHTPTLSQSSNGSSSATSQSSTQATPSSTASRVRTQPSDMSNIENMMKDMQASISASKSISGQLHDTLDQLAKPMPERTVGTFSPLESPTDPAIHEGYFSPIPPRNPKRAIHKKSDAAPSRPNSAKGNCKGCGEVIKGKSVSSADGRLTGRYHKQCFKCKTCMEPFATSTFYVLDDAPYCERHYHQLNGSLCTACDQGIEGNYLQTDSAKKYHRRCFTCTDCRTVLSEDYFEVHGRVYCERDSYRHVQQRMLLSPGTTTRVERRTTRLMMI